MKPFKKKEREGESSLAKLSSGLFLQSTAVETSTACALSYLVTLGKIEVGIGLPLQGLIFCCQGCQAIFLFFSICKVNGRLSTEDCCYCLLLRMSGFLSNMTIPSTDFPEGLCVSF